MIIKQLDFPCKRSRAPENEQSSWHSHPPFPVHNTGKKLRFGVKAWGLHDANHVHAQENLAFGRTIILTLEYGSQVHGLRTRKALHFPGACTHAEHKPCSWSRQDTPSPKITGSCHFEGFLQWVPGPLLKALNARGDNRDPDHIPDFYTAALWQPLSVTVSSAIMT